MYRPSLIAALLLVISASSGCGDSVRIDTDDAGDAGDSATPDGTPGDPDADDDTDADVDEMDASVPDAHVPDATPDDPDAALPAHIMAPVVSHQFGTVGKGERVTVTLRFTNDGGSPTGALDAWIVGEEAFSEVDDTCLWAILDPGESCETTMAFQSDELGAHRATLHAMGNPGGGEVIEILATVIAPPAPAHIMAPIVSFNLGTLPRGVSGFATVTFTNDGGSPTGPLSVWLVANPEFRPGWNNCLFEVLDPGESCQVQVELMTDELGFHRGTVDVQADPGGFEVVELFGNVIQLPTSIAR